MLVGRERGPRETNEPSAVASTVPSACATAAFERDDARRFHFTLPVITNGSAEHDRCAKTQLHRRRHRALARHAAGVRHRFVEQHHHDCRRARFRANPESAAAG